MHDYYDVIWIDNYVILDTLSTFLFQEYLFLLLSIQLD